MRVLRLVLVAVIALVSASSARADYVAQEIGVRFPDVLGGLRRQGEPYRYPQPGLGYSLRYANQQVRVDLYIYDGGQRGIGTGAGNIVTQQLAEAENEMRAFYQQQRQPAQRVSGGPETIGQVPWLVARYDVQQGGQAMRSVVMLTGFRDSFIKVRATYPAIAKDGSDPLTPVAAELSALLAAVGPPPGRGK
jgi:hypothetical protein